MRFTGAVTLIFAISTSFCMDIKKIEDKYYPTNNYWQQVNISEDYLKENASTFCLIRHAPTDANQKGVIQGQKLDDDIIVDEKSQDKLNRLSRLNWTAFYSAAQSRTQATIRRMTSHGLSTYLFNEQKLGKYEGVTKKEVLSKGEFWEMSRNPYEKIPTVELGSSVLNRFLYGIDSVAGKNNELNCICSSQCAINWFSKWANSDYSRTYKVDNFDSVIFQYKKDTKECHLITVEPVKIDCAIEILKDMGY